MKCLKSWGKLRPTEGKTTVLRTACSCDFRGCERTITHQAAAERTLVIDLGSFPTLATKTAHMFSSLTSLAIKCQHWLSGISSETSSNVSILGPEIVQETRKYHWMTWAPNVQVRTSKNRWTYRARSCRRCEHSSMEPTRRLASRHKAGLG